MNINKFIYGHLKSILALSLMVLLLACNKQPQEYPMEEVGDGYEDILLESIAPLEIRQENYGDSTIFSTPRLQFIAKLGSGKKNTLWSMRLDGSDRRQVANSELIFNGQTMVHTPIRSPDNRYVAVSMDGPNGFFRGFLDLKNKTATYIMKGGGYPFFNWTSDSENLIFYSDAEHYNYHVPTKKLTKRPTIYSSGLFLLPDDKEFLAMKNDGFWIHHFDGTVKKKIKLDVGENRRIKFPIISPDGKIIYFISEGKGPIQSHWVSVDNGEILGSEISKELLGSSSAKPIFSVDVESLLFRRGDYHRQVNLITKEIKDIKMKEVGLWGMWGIGKISLINYTPETDL